jgi:hypothetical protein
MDNTIDIYDRTIGALHDRPDVIETKPSTIQSVEIVGVSQFFTVQTYREREKGDTIFLVCNNKDGMVRLAIPPAVADTIARQREALTNKSRVKTGKASAQARKDRGELPGFMRKKIK